MNKEKIAEWKAKYGKLHEITVPNVATNGNEVVEGGNETYSGIFREPTRQDLSVASKKSAGLTDPIKFNETIVFRCFVDGDNELKTKDAFINAVADKLQNFIKEVEAEVKEL